MLGVSVNTVSAVLNRTRSNTRVSESTRAAILEAAQRVNYRPNALARSLRNRRAGMIGYFTDFLPVDSNAPFTMVMTATIQRVAAELGYDLVLHRARQGESSEALATRLGDGRIDGIVLFPPENPTAAEGVLRSRVPVVGVVEHREGVPCVLVDDESGGRLQAEHLTACGYRRVLYRPALHRPPSAQARERGFRVRADELGLQVIDGRAVRMDPEPFTPAERAVLASRDGGPLCLLCWEDTSAYAVLRELGQLGLRVPEDVGLMGFNDVPLQAGVVPNLTTIHAPWAEVATLAVQLLARTIEGERIAHLTTLPVRLAEGETTRRQPQSLRPS